MSKIKDTTEGLITSIAHIPINHFSGFKEIESDSSTILEQSAKTYSEISSLNSRIRFKHDLRDHFSYNEAKRRIDTELLNETYNSIINTLDDDFSDIEKSNFFDEWKDYLEKVIAQISNFDVNSRKILGGVLIATKGKDIGDFDRDGLLIFKECMYLLRQFRTTKNEAKNMINRLLNINSNLIIPMSIENITDEEEHRLEKLIFELTNK